jgi:hypothetical protein
VTTARDFVSLALKEAGVTGVGQTPLAEDINDCFTLLTRMLAMWQKKRWIVPYLTDISAIANGSISNRIGPGQYYNWYRPDKIQAAYFKQINAVQGSNSVSYPLRPIWSREDYSAISLKELNSWPVYYFYDNNFPYGNVFIWPVPSSNYEIHLIVKGNIGFDVELLSGSITTAGTLYTNGSYLAVPLVSTTGFGSGATADITVAGGVVTTVTLQSGGTGYKIGDILSVSAASIGGTGSDFVYTVTNTTSTLDAVFNMPEEYEEPIYYNLVVRIAAMYQKPLNPVHGKLAVMGMNVIRNSNTQISRLEMPSSLRRNAGNNFYIFNADAQ